MGKLITAVAKEIFGSKYMVCIVGALGVLTFFVGWLRWFPEAAKELGGKNVFSICQLLFIGIILFFFFLLIRWIWICAQQWISQWKNYHGYDYKEIKKRLMQLQKDEKQIILEIVNDKRKIILLPYNIKGLESLDRKGIIVVDLDSPQGSPDHPEYPVILTCYATMVLTKRFIKKFISDRT